MDVKFYELFFSTCITIEITKYKQTKYILENACEPLPLFTKLNIQFDQILIRASKRYGPYISFVKTQRN